MGKADGINVDELMKAATALRAAVRQAEIRLTEAKVRLERAEETAAERRAELEKLGFDPSRSDVPAQIKKQVDKADRQLQEISEALDEVEEAFRGDD